MIHDSIKDHPFETQVEMLFEYSSSATQARTAQRRADPAKQQQGRIASRDHKKASGQRRGQRQASRRHGRVAEMCQRFADLRLHERNIPTGRNVITALELMDGSVVVDPDGGTPLHFQLMTKLNVDPGDIRDGGFMVNGKYQRGSTDSKRIGNLVRDADAKNKPFGAKLKSKLPKQPPSKLWHVTLFASKILAGGFKTRNQLTGVSVLGGGSDDSVSFTEDRAFAETYANGLRMAIESMDRGFDPFNHKPWGDLAKKHGFPHRMMVGAVNRVVPEAVRKGWDHWKTTFEVLQAYSFDTRTFPLFMGGSWPAAIRRAKLSDVAVLEISSDGPLWWAYKPGEKEFRVFDVGNIRRARKVG